MVPKEGKKEARLLFEESRPSFPVGRIQPYYGVYLKCSKYADCVSMSAPIHAAVSMEYNVPAATAKRSPRQIQLAVGVSSAIVGNDTRLRLERRLIFIGEGGFLMLKSIGLVRGSNEFGKGTTCFALCDARSRNIVKWHLGVELSSQ